jgi:hypothetical protein
MRIIKKTKVHYRQENQNLSRQKLQRFVGAWWRVEGFALLEFGIFELV